MAINFADLTPKPGLKLTMMFVTLSFSVLGQSATALAPKSVLVIYSNNRLTPAHVEIDRGLSAALQSDDSGSIRVFSEFLDSPEFHGEAYEDLVASYLRGKYAAEPPYAIVVIADDALRFVARHRVDLFPGVPIVHAGVSTILLRSLSPLPSDIVGVTNDFDYAGTIAQALLWHPTARRLVLVTGASSRDRTLESRLRGVVPTVTGDHIAEFWSGLTLAELQERLAVLDRQTLVFTPGFYQDGAGNQMTPFHAVALIAKASKVPVYGSSETFIGTGVVGGRMASYEEIGEQAGRIVKAILGGVAPDSIRLPRRTPIRLHVDWRQVKRWGIDEKTIPADAVVHFRDPTIWEAHRTAVLIALSVFLLQMVLIAALYLERRRRSAAESTTHNLNTQLAHASRLAVAGELTASIAHEINQPLGAVQTSADAADLMLQAQTDRNESLIRIVTRIRRDTLRASEVIRRLRALLAKHEPERRPFDARVALTDVATILRPEAERRKVTFNVQPSFTPAIIDGDQTQIQQVLINLVLNAMDAVTDLPDNRRLVEVSLERDASSILINVRDQGHGVTIENLPKLFDSFFSTKQRGMGLGLAIARSIVESHGGRIWAENRAPSGAVFNIELPASVADSAKWRGAA